MGKSVADNQRDGENKSPTEEGRRFYYDSGCQSNQSEPKDGKHHVEATQIISKLVADKVHHEIDTFFAGLFHY